MGSATGCSFIDCYTENYGGAIDSGNAYYCNFTHCGCRKDGGAIGKGNAENCIFKECYTTSDGGAIDRGNAKNCEFIKCQSIRIIEILVQPSVHKIRRRNQQRGSYKLQVYRLQIHHIKRRIP